MPDPNLWFTCIVAFCAVFALLVVLALCIHLIAALFPERASDDDAAVAAAIAAAVSAALPGMQVSRIEEES